MADETAGAPKQSPPEQPGLEMARLALEREKVRLDYRKFVLGSVFVAIAIAFIPPSFQLATAVLEYVKSQAKLQLDDQNTKADRQTRELEFRQTYVKEFVSNFAVQDIELRIRLAEYFSKVASGPLRDGWVLYHEDLKGRRDKVREQIDAMEADYRLQMPYGQTMELDRIERNLKWLYNEVGYVDKGRSLVADPRDREPAIVLSPVAPQPPPTDITKSDPQALVIPELQEAQKALGVEPDGRYAAQTRAAVREFQTGMYRRNPSEWPKTEITGNLTSRSGRVLPTLRPMPPFFRSPFERAYLGNDGGFFTADPLATIDPGRLNASLIFLEATPEQLATAITPDDKMTLLRERIMEMRTKLNLPSSQPILDAALFAEVWKTSPLNVNKSP